jgi:hypothetical protein
VDQRRSRPEDKYDITGIVNEGIFDICRTDGKKQDLLHKDISVE